MSRFSCIGVLSSVASSISSIPCPWIHTRRFASSAQTARLGPACPNIFPSSAPHFDSYGYGAMLQDCVRNAEPIRGKILHGEILKRGDCLCLFSCNILLNLYVKFGPFLDACKLFDEMRERNTITYITLMQGHVRYSNYKEAINLFMRLYREGHELNPFVFTTVLKLLVTMEWTEMGSSVHSCVLKLGHETDVFVATALIDAYSVCGLVDNAREVFGGICEKDMISWTGIVCCFAENGCFKEALEFLSKMRLVGLMPNNFTFASVFKACLGLEDLDLGKAFHSCALKTRYEANNYVGISLLELYSAFEYLDDAHKAFDDITIKDVIPWSFMIGRYAQKGFSEEALILFCQMRRAFVQPNEFTFASLLQACATMENLFMGKQVHCHVLKVGLNSDVFISNVLMDVYAKCGRMGNTMELFMESSYINDVTWNTIIVGHVQSGDAEYALDMFLNALKCDVQATEVTYTSALRACAGLAALDTGAQIHSMAIKTFNKNIAVCNALIDMYGKCGSIKDACLVFDMMTIRDMVSWNAMISGYSLHGLSVEALETFEMMKKSEFKPNKLTFVSVLAACSNAGLLEQGQTYFTSMVHDYAIEPCMEHYTCMVWLLGRAGHLNKAVKLIEGIPTRASVMLWRALLGACAIHKDFELGKISAEHVLEIEPHDDSAHVILSNLYATARRWDGVASIRKRMKKNGVKKEPGLSWIQNQGNVHYFTVGDTSHPDMRLIKGVLEWLNIKIKKSGYVPNRDSVLVDVDDGEKDQLLWMHSERLALAYGLIVIPPGRPIRILKNLRICIDCHAAMKCISMVIQREIIVRDMKRFHHFHDGICSCGDYW